MTTTAPLLDIKNLHHAYGPGSIAIDDVTFSVNNGKFTSIVGPSGCGKTTLMKSIAGLLSFTSGQVNLLGQDVTEVPSDLAMVFQDYSRSLFPWLKIGANVELPLRYRGLDVKEREQRTQESLEAVGLGNKADKYPWELSGGMQQRAAIARALAFHPKLLLMDEPFASVDAQTRADLEDLVGHVHRTLGMTILFVTHDIDEAVYLADEVLVLSKSPSRVVERIAVDLPAERDQVTTKESSAFVTLRSQVARLIRHAPDSESVGAANE
ncbi:ABC transporter ATP-binding protein [Cryobacterium sp. Y50]|uniref:ABC transporter ATP-binding protein n=1 Tax=Cryobacterium sp. Y50 TaxID=2048286 RepID=UPI000CE4D77E|nr:ABC transporter ATP-binding protein [Cryobacterium sp. Y50]